MQWTVVNTPDTSPLWIPTQVLARATLAKPAPALPTPLHVWLPCFTADLPNAFYAQIVNFVTAFNGAFARNNVRIIGITAVIRENDTVFSPLLLTYLQRATMALGVNVGVTASATTPGGWAALADVVRVANVNVPGNPVTHVWIDSQGSDVAVAVAAFGAVLGVQAIVVAGGTKSCGAVIPSASTVPVFAAPELYDIDDTPACVPAVPCPTPTPPDKLRALAANYFNPTNGCIGWGTIQSCLLSPGKTIPLLSLQCNGRSNLSGVTYTGPTSSYYGSPSLESFVVNFLGAYRDAAVNAGWPADGTPVTVGLYETAYLPLDWAAPFVFASRWRR